MVPIGESFEVNADSYGESTVAYRHQNIIELKVYESSLR
jgi:hypothetical protein